MRRRFLVTVFVLLGMAACTSGAAREAGIPVAPPAQIPTPPAAPPPQRPSFADWLADFEQEALADGISQTTLDQAFRNVAPIPRVIELDHRQPEVKLSFDDYIARIVSDARVGAAQRHLIVDHALLQQVSLRYGVPPGYIVALWGMETDFGAEIGNFPIVAALATLAYDGRRAALFRSELLAALQIVDRLNLPPEKLRGSWAGAMGQTQFMPSSFLKYAVAYDGGDVPDIWSKRADVFASIANYLASAGWDAQDGWGLEVTLPSGFDPTLIANISGKVDKPVSDWQALGVRATDGGDLPSLHGALRLVQPGGATGPTLLVTVNYRVLLKWNRSLYFATAVSYLADRIEN
jgi:membrane-bound lytic murein transglycosylase B